MYICSVEHGTWSANDASSTLQTSHLLVAASTSHSLFEHRNKRTKTRLNLARRNTNFTHYIAKCVLNSFLLSYTYPRKDLRKTTVHSIETSFPAGKFPRYVNSGVIRSYDRVAEWPEFVLTDFWSNWIFRCRLSEHLPELIKKFYAVVYSQWLCTL